MRQSADTILCKLDTVFQEALRRLYNISPILPWQEHATHLPRFIQTMMISGYSEEERFNTIKGAIVRWEEMVSKVENGEIESVNRPRQCIEWTLSPRGTLPDFAYVPKKQFKIIKIVPFL